MSKQRAKGTAYETYLLPKLRDIFGPQVDRAPLRGGKDRGDFDGATVALDHMAIEAKKRNKWDLPSWIRKTQRKSAQWMIVFAGDKRQDLKEDYVVMPLDMLIAMLDEMYERGYDEAPGYVR